MSWRVLITAWRVRSKYSRSCSAAIAPAEPVDGVGIETILDPLQPVDQLATADGETTRNPASERDLDRVWTTSTLSCRAINGMADSPPKST